MAKRRIDVMQRLIANIKKDQNAVERALVVLDDKDLWHCKSAPKTLSLQRAKYLAGWVRGGKHLTGKYVDEARTLVLEHVSELVRPSLEHSRRLIKELEQRIAYLKEWAAACEDELSKLPFDAPQQPDKEVIDGKTMHQICHEEGLY